MGPSDILNARQARRLGEIIRRRRVVLSIGSQRQLAAQSGVSKPTVQRLERGEVRNPRADVLGRIEVTLSYPVGTLIDAARGLLPDEHVFTMPTGSPVNEGYRSRTWRQAVKDAGLAGRGPRPHDLRHTHASLLILAGVPLTVVQRRLGHATIAITSDVYGHVSPAAERLAASAMDVALGLEIPDTVPDGLSPPRSVD